MRPVTRGSNPHAGDFADYQDAKRFLLSRLGPFCSYCERRIPSSLAVEHIQPKGLKKYEHLAGKWDNFLLVCVNCNSTKSDSDVLLDRYYLPDRDNTFAAFEYLPDGAVNPRQALDPIAADTLQLTGLGKPMRETRDENGRFVAMDRVSDRMTIWGIALEAKADLDAFPIPEVRRGVVRTATGHGFFSVWMTVFAGDPVMCRMLIEGFDGTAKDCFDASMVPVSPRPANGLASGSKI